MRIVIYKGCHGLLDQRLEIKGKSPSSVYEGVHRSKQNGKLPLSGYVWLLVFHRLLRVSVSVTLKQVIAATSYFLPTVSSR